MVSSSTLKLAAAFIAVVGGLGAGLPWLAIGRTGGAFTQSSYYSYGKVASVERCEVGKYRYSCNITTDKHTFKDKIDVTRYPGKEIKVGDEIGIKEQWNRVKVETLKCKNGQCVPSAVCFDWMPCYDKKF